MTATITALPNTYVSAGRIEAVEHTFESALKGVEQAQRALLMARLSTQARVQEAINEAQETERLAQNKLDRALLSFSFVGGSAEDLADIAEGMPEQFHEVLESVEEPVVRIDGTA